MLTINISINNKPFEDALAESITLQEGGNLSKEFTRIILDDLKSRVNRAIDTIKEEELRDAIEVASTQKKADFEDIIEAIKPM